MLRPSESACTLSRLRRRSPRILRLATALAGVSVIGLLVAVQVSPAAPRAVTATVTPVASLTVPQGDPFAFNVTLTSQESVEQRVELRLQPAGSSNQIFFDDGEAAPAGTTVLSKHVVPSQWFAAIGSYQVLVTVDGAPIGPPLTFTVSRPRVQPAVFQDVSAKVGIAVPTPQHPCTMQVAGVAWADVNGDGRLDLFLPRGTERAKLFINRGKRGFVDEARKRGVAGNGTLEYGAVFADYDNDGDPDLYVTREGTDILYRNNGKGFFKDVTASAGVGGGNLSHRTASWGDYDNDGRLDLYVTNYGFCYGPGQADQLFHQNRNGTFTDVSDLIQADYSSLTPDLGQGRGFQAAWFDYNGDGRQDLFLANDYYLPPADTNRLWRNDGPGPGGRWRFTDVTVPSGVGVKMNSMGIGIGDYNRDGLFDIAVSNIGANRLFRYNGNGTFSNGAGLAGVEGADQAAGQNPITWGTISGDFNLDGWEDLYFAAGYVEVAHPVPQRDEMFVNDHGHGFVDLRAPSHADDPGWSRGVSTADYNKDGRLDLAVADQAGTVHLYRNVTPRGTNHWLEVNTIGSRSNRDGCGARLVAVIKGASLVREVYCGSVGLAGGSDKVVHIGLGPLKRVTRLTVTWPSGVKQVFRNVKADRLLTAAEPKV